jgi:hypothetical protein
VWWTYEQFPPGDDLDQGDLLFPTPELQAVLDEVHPHFCNPKYIGFSVLTQGCDLVRRKRSGLPKARHINIGVVRALRPILPKLIETAVKPVAPGVFPASGMEEARRLLDRILDQNEQALGLFYLHQDADVGLGEPCVVNLRVSVSLKAEHYSTLVLARRGRLTSDFRGKLGWLVGNLFSRTASPDWAEKEGDGAKSEAITELLGTVGTNWIDDVLVRVARERGIDIQSKPFDEIVTTLEEQRPPPPLERAIDAAASELKRIQDVAPEVIEKLKKLVGEGSTESPPEVDISGLPRFTCVNGRSQRPR